MSFEIMNTLLKAFTIGTICLSLATLAHAVGDNCYQIQNQDAKNFCLATAKNDNSYCYQISKQDEKNMCLAVTKRYKSYCYQISKQDEKNLCLAKF
jgi:hypothetical protein